LSPSSQLLLLRWLFKNAIVNISVRSRQLLLLNGCRQPNEPYWNYSSRPNEHSFITRTVGNNRSPGSGDNLTRFLTKSPSVFIDRCFPNDLRARPRNVVTTMAVSAILLDNVNALITRGYVDDNRRTFGPNEFLYTLARSNCTRQVAGVRLRVFLNAVN